MYNAKQVAGYIVEKCIRDGQLISNIQLQFEARKPTVLTVG